MIIAQTTTGGEKTRKSCQTEGGNYLNRRFGGPLDWIFGPAARLVLAMLLLSAFGLWRYQRGDTQTIVEQARDIPGSRIDPTLTVEIDPSKAIVTHKDYEQRLIERRPMRIPLVPRDVTGALSSNNTLVAGLVLLLSAVFRGNMVGLLAYLAAAVAVIGPMRQLPVVGYLNEWFCMAAAIAIGLAGIIFFRAK